MDLNLTFILKPTPCFRNILCILVARNKVKYFFQQGTWKKPLVFSVDACGAKIKLKTFARFVFEHPLFPLMRGVF